MQPLIYGAVDTHFTVVAMSVPAFFTAMALFTFDVLIMDKTVSTATSHTVVLMALQTDIRAVLVAMTAAIKAPVADRTEIFIHNMAFIAIRTMKAVFRCAVIAHQTRITITLAFRTFLALDTPVTILILYIAFSTIRACQIMLQMALKALMIGTLGAFTAALIAFSASVAHFVFVFVFSAILAVVSFFLCAVFAQIAFLAKITVGFARATLQTMVSLSATT